MAEWIYEAGIGETRAALIKAGAIVEARIELDEGGLRAGTIAPAKLVSVADRVVRFEHDEEALLSTIPNGVTEGAAIIVEIVRERISEAGKPKRAKAVPALDAEAILGPSLLSRVAPARQLYPHEPDALERAGWTEALEEAETGYIAFPGGSLRFVLTPAMTIFDVDGVLPPEALALAAAEAVGSAIRRHDITGSIGIDFPTLSGREARKAVDMALDAALPNPFERTAMNGFGFVQIVRRRSRASLPEMIQFDPVGARVRALLRCLERDPKDIALPMREHDYLMLRPHWLQELERRTGRSIRIAKDELK